MGWKGTLRTISAVARAAERDAQRRHKQELKAQIASDAADAVDDWESYIRNLVSIHTDLADAIKWHEIAARPRPSEPFPSKVYQERATSKLNRFNPGLFDFLHGGTDKRRMKLEAEIADAKENDRKDYANAIAEHTAAVADWDATQ